MRRVSRGKQANDLAVLVLVQGVPFDLEAIDGNRLGSLDPFVNRVVSGAACKEAAGQQHGEGQGLTKTVDDTTAQGMKIHRCSV